MSGTACVSPSGIGPLQNRQRREARVDSVIPVMVARPGHYSQGTVVKAVTNLLPVRVTLTDDKQAPRQLSVYSIKFTPELPGNLSQQTRIVGQMKAELINRLFMGQRTTPIFTGMTILTVAPTCIQGEPDEAVEFTASVVVGRDPDGCEVRREYTVVIEWKATFPLDPAGIEGLDRRSLVKAKMHNALSLYVDNAVRHAIRGKMRTWAQFRDAFYNVHPGELLQVYKRYSLAKGFSTATVDTEPHGPHVAIGVRHLLLEGRAADILLNIQGRTQGTGQDKQDAVKLALHGRTCVTPITGIKYTIDDVDYLTTPDHTFTDSKGQVVTYRQYFLDRYAQEGVVDYPAGRDYPMLVCIRRGREVRIPPPLAYMTGISKREGQELNQVRQELTNRTRMNAARRVAETQQRVQALIGTNNSPSTQAAIADSGIEFRGEFLQVEGRELSKDLFASRMSVGNLPEDASPSDPVEGHRISSALKFRVDSAPQAVVEIFIVHQQGEKEKKEVDALTTALTTQMNEYGLRHNVTALRDTLRGAVRRGAWPSEWAEYVKYGIHQVRLKRDRHRNNQQPAECFMVVIMPLGVHRDVYGTIKRLMCIEQPILSQCVKSKTVHDRFVREPASSMVRSKLVCQMISKMGGWGWTLPAIADSVSEETDAGVKVRKETMVIGINAGQVRRTQVLTMTASFNQEFTRYLSVVEVLRSEPSAATFMEMEADKLQQHLPDFTRHYAEKNGGKLPERIVIYRDGLPEAEKRILFKLYEDAIKAAIQDFPRRTRLVHPSDVTQTGQSRPSSSPPAFSPCVTLCIVALRGTQGVKFAQVHPDQQVTNPPPHTVFDRGINRQHKFDFYIAHQQVPTGSVSPTYYDVLYNSPLLDAPSGGSNGCVGFNADNFINLTTQLANLYQNWAGPIRMPQPLMYAKKLSDLVSEYLRERPDESLRQNLFYL